MGVTKDKLIETANHYKKLFAEKKIAFDDSVNKELQTGVGSMQSEVESLKQKNVNIDQQIQDLIKEKAKNEERVLALSNDINNRSLTLNAKKNDFDVTYQSIVAEIDHNVLLINQHLQ
jgi:signal transduction histidine kinase